jgi:plastocyanin
MTLSPTVQRATLSILLLTVAQSTRALAQDATSDKPSTNIATGTSSPTAVQSSTSTSSSSTQTHTIQVGLADHKMRPETIEAAVGDIVEFDFYPLNHSVVRAEYGFPCIPYDMTGSEKTGFFSGFRPVDKVLDNPPKYSVRINDTEPMFYYCSAPGSCITYGMVGGINLNSSMSIDKQRTLAMDSAYMVSLAFSVYRITSHSR